MLKKEFGVWFMNGENCEDIRKICIIAGAGAEVPYQISDGLDFAKKTTGIVDECTRRDLELMNKAIKEYYNACLKVIDKDKKAWYPSRHFNTNLQIQQLLKAAIIDRRVENSEEATNKEAQNKKDGELIKKYTDNYNQKERCADIEREMNELLEQYISYKGIFDKEFSSLLSPRSYGISGFWKIINMYTRAYLCIVKDIIYGKRVVDKDTYLKILKEPIETLKKINIRCQALEDENAYYQFMVGMSNVSLVTTNYTPLALLKSGIDEEHVAYVNGKLGWFESAYQMRTFDLKNNEDADELKKEKDLYFPYIFTQSSTKPIVDEKMVMEYKKMADLIEEAETIIILGYNINSDDNHLNGQIRKAALRAKKIIYMAYEAEGGKVGITEEQFLNRLRLSKRSNIKYIKYKDNLTFKQYLHI